MGEDDLRINPFFEKALLSNKSLTAQLPGHQFGTSRYVSLKLDIMGIVARNVFLQSESHHWLRVVIVDLSINNKALMDLKNTKKIV